MTAKKTAKQKKEKVRARAKKVAPSRVRSKRAATPDAYPAPTLAPEEHRILRDALKILTDKNTEKVVVANFLNKCAVEVRPRRIKVTVTAARGAAPANFAAGACFKSHSLNPADPVTIWRDGEPDESVRLTRREAIDAGYEACSW